jgi:DNA polymerase-3 subunit delta'
MFSFKEIVGHSDIMKHFKYSIRSNKISHAYLIAGEDDSGKMTLANAFAMALQCENLDPQTELEGVDSCGICPSCKQFKGNNHPDIVYVTHEKASIGVEDIRDQVNNDIIIKPYSSKYKIYIIDEAQKMTPQAQNALLKTLEEPPEYAIIILLSNNINRMLDTIQSRCIILQVKAIDNNLIKEYLMTEYQIPDYQAELSAAFAQGNVGKAIKYASSEKFTQIKDKLLHIIKRIDRMKNYEVIEVVKDLGKEKDDVLNILDLILLWYRDVLMYKVTKNLNLLLYTKEHSYISKQAKVISYEGIQNILKIIEEAKSKVSANVSMETTLQLMLFTIKENSND